MKCPNSCVGTAWIRQRDLNSYDFSKKILGVYPHQLRLAWDRAVFSGTGQAPNEVDDETEMLEAIASTPGSIGYIQQSSLNDQVRVLDIE